MILLNKEVFNMKIRNILLCGLLAASCALSVGCSKAENSSGGDNTDVSVSDNAGVSSSVVGNIGDVELQAGDLIAEFEIEGYGTIKAKLFPEVAPKGVENFVKLAKDGFYDGLTIHRVMKGFMLQGGSLNGDGTGGEAADGGSFDVEINDNMRHFYGALCYANAGGQNTCQFYIVNNNEKQAFADHIQVLRDNAAICESYKAMFEEGAEGYIYYEAMRQQYEAMAAELDASTPDEIKAKYNETGGTPSLDGGYTVFGQVFEGFDVIDSISDVAVKENAGGELSEPITTITIKTVKITEYAG